MLTTTNEHNSVTNESGVMALAFCISSEDLLYLYQASQKYLNRFQS